MVDDTARPLVGVIEDDDACRRAIGRLLQASGFEAALFDSAEDFIASPPGRPWLCLIVDVQLPGMSGIDLQRKIRTEGSQVPVILTTGNRTIAVRERAQEAGCAAFLWKPFSAAPMLDLLASISRQTRL